MITKSKSHRTRSQLPSTLPAENITAIVDSREQKPLDLAPLMAETATLATGDYSVKGLEDSVAVERKSLPDLIKCVGKDRKRFDREMQRMLAYPVRAVVVEATWRDLESGQWRGQITPEQAVGSVLGWVARGVPVILAGNRQRAGEVVRRILIHAARRRWREARELSKNTV